MPNPFIKMGPRNIGREPVDRSIPTGAIEPKPEIVAGTVFAYRGMEQHGVEVSKGNAAIDERMLDNEAAYVPEYESLGPEPEPVPVRIVQEDSVEITLARITQLPVGDSNQPTKKTQIVGNDFTVRTRRLTRIKNIGTQTVYIGHDGPSADVAFGWPLAANETFESASHQEFWAVTSDANIGKVAIYVTYAVNATHDNAPHGR